MSIEQVCKVHTHTTGPYLAAQEECITETCYVDEIWKLMICLS